MKNYSIILLAAGLSKRMGVQNKLLLPFRGTTLLEFCADRLLSLRAREIIVVTGHQAPQVQFRLADRPFVFTFNRSYKKGMTSSIQQGVSVCDPKSAGALICQGDMPNLEVQDLQLIEKTILELMSKNKKGIVQPRIKKRLGNPVFFTRNYFNDILTHEEPNGCKSIIQKNKEYLVKIKLNNKNAFADIDTKSDYGQY
ncbi:MAG: NTP transferase domain-containing protein [Saprospiraceae bacterium]